MADAPRHASGPDPDTVARIADALRAGNSRSDAARYGGIPPKLLGVWLRKGERGEAGFAEVFEVLQAAEQAAVVGATSVVTKAIKNGDWKAATWWLERRRPAQWSKRHGNNKGPDMSKYVEVTVVAELLKQVGDIVKQAVDDPVTRTTCVRRIADLVQGLRDDRRRVG